MTKAMAVADADQEQIRPMDIFRGPDVEAEQVRAGGSRARPRPIVCRCPVLASGELIQVPSVGDSHSFQVDRLRHIHSAVTNLELHP